MYIIVPDDHLTAPTGMRTKQKQKKNAGLRLMYHKLMYHNFFKQNTELPCETLFFSYLLALHAQRRMDGLLCLRDKNVT